ncbi:hypothetical protein [Thiorhodococcus fuscus]|uniref:Uncharacterized protein n=1 Tax=Thiorhodococcus fuscus TaxID=527200 RepID=A0ABW4YEM3_9GAMM
MNASLDHIHFLLRRLHSVFKLILIPDGTFPGDPEYEDDRTRWKSNSDRWLKASVAEWNPAGPRIRYEEVDLSVYPPTDPRDYR